VSVSAGCKLANYCLYLAKQVGEEAIWKEETKERKRIRCEYVRWDEVKRE
jgi:hypothetical protein